MDSAEGPKRRILAVVGTVTAVAGMALAGLWAALAVLAATTLALFAADRVSGRGVALFQTAILYCGVPAVAVLVVHRAGGAVSVYWLLAVVWGTDIGAYAFGRLIGGPKLAPSISPKKTWAGAVGGLACGPAAAAGVMAGFGMQLGVGVVLAALAAALATEIGDLLESGLKRWYDVKDSGNLIPGHGGLMDRFDGLWAAAPVAAIFCMLFDGGVDRW